ncbi:hypothetical protein Mp_3g05320 [Marchantia polymorpha subsp. ruderalis]|uniref:FPL domain-containing protein n=2 Tax=Marchantia polymorpha TaxID=3197 RepID=A0AAF6AXN2_MARPO|nr:hypothetical protein MARPO_0006s0005 [Marchantia polymorpha]BBN04516.1 hypothetical protein Mp_3g05320 [Marchantia polymorpha subsp. ruderalis]|eukprot:PTQ47952.1 hypothetical protein MARPO_0006s0005 [Marchantia polymorpha]
MWFWKTRERFSLDELKYLNEQLQRVTVVNDSNKDFVIETLRSIAEHMIWGDQHDPTFFDYFMEKQVMAHFLRILNDSNKNSSVAVQLLQTLSIIIGNIRSEHAIYYLFSNEYINNLITYPFDFRHEETLAYYISFLRTISIKLDQNTVSFFIKTKNDEVISFPLYSEAIKFFHHEESMVRIAVRTLTLNVYNVDDECIQKFVMSAPVVSYFSDLVTFLRQQSINLDGLVAEAARAPQSAPTIGRLEAAIAEIGDLLFYCNDIMCSGIPKLNELMSKHIANLLVLPVLIPSLCPVVDTAAATGGLHVSPLCSMYLLSRLTHIVKRKPLVNYISAGLLQNPQPAPTVAKENGVGPSKDSTLSSNLPVIVNQEDGSSRPSPTLKEARSLRAEDNVKKEENASPESESWNEKRRLSQLNDCESPIESPRESLLSHLLHNDDKLVLASLCVLVSLLQNEALDDMLLDALGILPRRKRHKHMLLQALMGSQSEEEPELFSDPPEHFDDEVSLGIRNFKITDFVDFVNVQPKSSPDAGGGDGPGIKTKHRSEVLDALMQLLCRRPPPCAEALWHAGWLLRQLLPYHEHKLSIYRLTLLDSAYKAARDDIIKELTDCWCDVIPSVVTEEWRVCRKALESPSLQRDSSFVLLPRTLDSHAEVLCSGDVSSSVVGERMRAAVKVFVALHQMQHLLSEGTWPEFPVLADPKEEPRNLLIRVGLKLSTVSVGTEVDLFEGNAMPCRVAFERGKERSVYLLVAHKERDAASWLLLAEDTPSRNGHGIVRVIAPLAGSKPRVDDDHPRWLHLRIRSPHWPSADAGKLGTGGSRVKRLVDGRWTLAFSDEESCKNARVSVTEMIETQSKLVKQVLAPLLDPTPAQKSLEELANESHISNS